jgi:hypothetical protein
VQGFWRLAQLVHWGRLLVLVVVCSSLWVAHLLAL